VRRSGVNSGQAEPAGNAARHVDEPPIGPGRMMIPIPVQLTTLATPYATAGTVAEANR